MPLSDGDPAEARDTWFRVITDALYFRNDGTLASNAFSGTKVISPPDPPRQWSLELSGIERPNLHIDPDALDHRSLSPTSS